MGDGGGYRRGASGDVCQNRDSGRSEEGLRRCVHQIHPLKPVKKMIVLFERVQDINVCSSVAGQQRKMVGYQRGWRSCVCLFIRLKGLTIRAPLPHPTVHLLQPTPHDALIRLALIRPRRDTRRRSSHGPLGCNSGRLEHLRQLPPPGGRVPCVSGNPSPTNPEQPNTVCLASLNCI